MIIAGWYWKYECIGTRQTYRVAAEYCNLRKHSIHPMFEHTISAKNENCAKNWVRLMFDWTFGWLWRAPLISIEFVLWYFALVLNFICRTNLQLQKLKSEKQKNCLKSTHTTDRKKITQKNAFAENQIQKFSLDPMWFYNSRPKTIICY